MGFMGYRRSDGSCGIRNHVVVMSSVSCANGVVNAIAREVPDVKTVTHTEGCGRGPADWEVAVRTLSGLARNPNVSAVLVIGLGCETIPAALLAEEIRRDREEPVEHLVIQARGGSQKTAQAGIEIARRFVADAKSVSREPCGWEQLVVGLECGGSDALSGVTANPLVGRAADWLVNAGGTVILSETTEMIGTEQVLSRRAASPEIAEKLVGLITSQREKTEQFLGAAASMVISPGNIEGGLSNIVEKSLGCIVKGGTTPVNELIAYAAAPSKKGLVIMDTPGSDIFSLTGMAAGGAALLIFTTGRGTPVGFPVAPVIKVASNSQLFENMKDDMDVNAGRALEGVSMEEAGEQLCDLVRMVAAGEQTKAEINRQDVVAIFTAGPPF